MNITKSIRTMFQFFLLSGFVLILIACGGAADGDDTDPSTTNANPEVSEDGDAEELDNDAADESDDDSQADDSGESADISGLPRFITEPRTITKHFDLMDIILTIEYTYNGEHTYRLEWTGEEKIDGVMTDKFHYYTDHPNVPEEYKEFDVWVDEDGVVDVAHDSGEELIIEVVGQSLADITDPMRYFDLLYRDKIIDEVPTGEAELISHETTEDTWLDYDVERHSVEVYFKDYDENIKFTIVEEDNFEIVIATEEKSDGSEYSSELDVKELSFR